MAGADFLALLLMGLLGTGHCIGMCGAFAVAAAAPGGRWTAVLARQVAYQAGKALTYLLLALLLTLAGRWAAGGAMVWLRNGFGGLVGVCMIGLGLAYALEVRWPPRLARRAEGRAACGLIAVALSSPGLARSFLVGWLNGFLPCGLSLAALAYAASFGRAGAAALGALVFGFATLPGLFVTALLGQSALARRRRGLLRLAGATLAALGALTLVRGVPAVHEWFHRHTVLPW